MTEPTYYHRQYEHDVQGLEPEDKSCHIAQRVFLAALPFLSLNRSFSPIISYTMNITRTFACLAQLLDAVQQENYLEAGTAFLHTIVAVIAIAALIFNNTLCMIITSIHDMFMNLCSIIKHLANKEYEQAFADFLQLINSSLYLIMILHGSLEMIIASLLFQIIVCLYTSQSEFRQGHVIEGLSNLAMGGVRGCQTHSCIQLLKFQHELEKAINKATKEHYVGKLEEEWQFPSDHIPVGIKLGKNRIISWNVLNEHFIDWVYKDSQGLKGSMITDLDKPSTKYPSITLREELIIQYILQIIASNKNIILSLQECRPEFISALTKAMPPNMGFVLSDFSLLRKDQEITLYNKDVFTFIESESSIVHAFESDKKRTLMDLTFVEKESGTRLQIINTHIPGNPAGPGPNEFARYVLTHAKENCILVALGDMNFNEETMKKAFEVEGQKLGSHLSLENLVDYNTDIEPDTFIAKDIDLIFVSKNHSLPCQSMRPDEILQGLQSTVDLLSHDAKVNSLRYEYLHEEYRREAIAAMENSQTSAILVSAN